MSNSKIWIIMFFCLGFVILTSGCANGSPGGNQTGNMSAGEATTTVTTPANEVTMTTLSTTIPIRPTTLPATVVPTPPVTYSVSTPLAMSDSYRYSAGQNVIIARFVHYDLAENYGELSSGGTAEYSFPDTIFLATKGTRFLFVYFTFVNNGRVPADMPGAEMFGVISNDRTYTYPEDSMIPQSPGNIVHIITQVNGTRKNMHGLTVSDPRLRLPVGFPFSSDWSWYVPFIVSDKFDPNTSYVSFKFNDNSSAVWKFS